MGKWDNRGKKRTEENKRESKLAGTYIRGEINDGVCMRMEPDTVDSIRRVRVRTER